LNPNRVTWIGRTDSGVVRQRLYDRDIGTLLLSPLDPGRKAWDAAIRKEGAHTGRYIDPHWYGLAADGKALAFRQVCDAACTELVAGEMLMLDLEFVSPEYLRRLLFGSTGNRGLVGSNNPQQPTGTQAGRPLAYTNMPFQNHTVVDFVAIWNAGLHWYPQLYYGDMSPADVGAVLLEIERDMRAWVVGEEGWPVNFSERLHPFYDGKLYATDQRDGAWFTAERIPGVFSPTAWMGRLLQARRAPVTGDSLRAYYTKLAEATSRGVTIPVAEAAA
jgi:hypothetical protein